MWVSSHTLHTNRITPELLRNDERRDHRRVNEAEGVADSLGIGM